ncbi:SET and MYND domain-containing protein 4 isoform X2 [Hyla sarda]|uniref:SET and MYND domain-containing protein 4 isoform X2 n=1 Tax=Hyla sarda TaxID=327740 RepID=UPI0024C46180|nr:SET and MYND domain-containing protein 4 isoform X2 [Hyla sarda]
MQHKLLFVCSSELLKLMELPVAKWQDYAQCKWSQLSSHEKGKFSPGSDLKESFDACWLYLQQEEEEVLERLSSDLSVGKEPHAVLFYKDEGNKRFGRKQYTAATVLYTKAICHGTPGTEEMAVCFANRSAALFHLGHFSACLEDIEHAQQNGYPERLQSKILQRQADCLQKQKQRDISNTKSSRTESKCVVNHRQQELKGNPQLPHASSSVNLKVSASKGRHLVASKDIGEGELLICEEAYVSVGIPDRESVTKKNTGDISITNCDLYCHHCLQRMTAPLPCQHCSFARYCTSECMDQAWKYYHNVECSLGGYLLVFGVFCHTALRTVLLTGYKQVLTIFSHYISEKFQACAIDEDCKLPYSSDYKSLFSLLSHIEHHKGEHKFLCALTSAALCKKLDIGLLRSMETSPPTGDSVSLKDKSHDLQILGSMILHHMLQLHCNAQAVTVIHEEFHESVTSLVESSKSSRLATALFPVLSLLNHSCDPNTSVSFQGRCVMVRASRPIRKGDEILHCYGPHKLRMTFEKRQKLLKDQYFFVCQCKACIQEQKSTGRTLCDFRCPRCHSFLKGDDVLHCVNESCAHWLRRDEVLLRLQNLQCAVHAALKQLQNDYIEIALRRLESCLSEGKEFLSHNHMLFGEIFDHLAHAEASKGNWAAAAGHLQKSIELVSQRYGPSSVELGHELFKLAQILFNGREVDDALGIIMRAQDILSVHYGPDNGIVQELLEMKACLLELPGMNTV